MKKAIAIVICLFVSIPAFAVGPLTNSVSQVATLAWSYPVSYFSNANQQIQTTFTNPITWPALTNLSYYVYGATTLNGTNTQWNFYVATNNPTIITNSDGSLWHVVSVPLLFPVSQQFFSIQASNATGKSFFAGLAATPLPPPSQGNFQVLSTQ